MQEQGRAQGDQSGEEPGGGVGVADEEGHHADGHEEGEEVDEWAAFEHPKEGKGQGTQEHGDDADGDEHGSDHA